MKTLKQFSHTPKTIPAITAWYLSDLGEARGRQELFTKQSPQKLKVYRLKTAYKEFEERVGQLRSPKGAKTELVTSAIEKTTGPFRIADLQKECPGVSVDMIRLVLKKLRGDGQVECLGRGQRAQW